MAVMLLRTFPVTHARARPIVGRRFFETARHDNRIKFARARNRHERGAGSRPANACGSPGGIRQYHLDVAGSDYRRYGRHTRRQRGFDWVGGRCIYRSSLEVRPIMMAGGRLEGISIIESAANPIIEV